RHANVRRAVVASLIVMLVVSVLGHESLEEFFQVASSRRRGVFHEGKAATGVANENRCRPVRDFAAPHNGGDFTSYLVGALSFATNLERFTVDRHRATLTAAPHPASFRFAQSSEDWIVF